MSIYKELSYLDQNISTITGLQFCVLSPEEMLRRSVAKITVSEAYSGQEPVNEGLFDIRMGVIDNNKICRTCEQKNTFCPGHFGHIELAVPIFHIKFFDIVRKVMRCVCFRCSKLLAAADSAEVVAIRKKRLSNQKRFDLMNEISQKIKACTNCGAKQPVRYAKDGIYKLVGEWKNDKNNSLQIPGEGEPVATNSTTGVTALKQDFGADDVLRILKRMTDEDIEALGFSTTCNRPEWMILTIFPVPPPCVRPAVRNDAGQICHDDLTHKLSDIIKMNNLLLHKMEQGHPANSNSIMVPKNTLQYHCATFVDNQIPGVAAAQQRNGRKLKSLSDRLKKKEGRIRGNLNGKRVDQSARSVITPDPYISIDELGVPFKIAMNQTFPEVVNQYNIDEMKLLVKNGPDVYPGAKFIRKMSKHDSRTISLKHVQNRDSVEVEFGDIVDRHIRDGDYVLFNRQPSLHKMSMMCHKVKVMPYQTFRLNPLTTTPYNADFDGDKTA